MSTSLRTGRAKDERSGSWFDQLTTSGSTSSPRAVRPAHHERFDKLTTSECPINTLARPEPFDSPLILSLSKDERLAQDRAGRRTSGLARGSRSLAYNRTLRDRGMTGHEGDAATVMSVSSV